MDIIQQLEELGLKDKTAAAYLALLQLQKANAHQIAKEASIERTTVYSILEELTKKQLVTQSRSGKRITYLAESPARFQQLLFRQSEILKGLIPALIGMEGKIKYKPTIKYYEGRENILRAYKDTLNCREKLFRNMAAVPYVEDLLGDKFINRYTAERVKKRIFTKSLRSYPEKKEEIKNWYLKDENKEVLRETRYLGPSIQIDAFIKTYDDIVMLISFQKDQREPSAIVVESPELAQTMKALFDIAWAGAKKV